MRRLQHLAWIPLTASLCAIVTAAPPTTAPSTQPVPATPQVGDAAPDSSLATLEGKTISLAETLKEGPAVVVVLRGWPGYQCPICTRQVGDLIVRAKDFNAEKATVLLIYPGPADHLKEHAAEFAIDKSLPANFRFVIDPDYGFTNAWKLRWDAQGETAYPSSFVIDRGGVVRFAKVSQSHGGRASTAELLNAVIAAR